MKRCPTCQRTYTDDSLTFCLQDGSPLLSVSDSSPPSYGQGARTEVPPQPIPPTIVSPRPDTVTVEQQRVTNPTWEEIGPRSAAPAAQPATRNRALTAGIFAIVILLLGLVGIGLALLLRGSSEGKVEKATVENRNGSANVNHNAQDNTNSNVSNKLSANASPTPKATSTPPLANSNGSQPPPADAAARAEAKILANSSLTESDLAGLSPTILRRLGNAVYARHGRTFNTPEIQSYFNSRPWYRPRSDYSDSDLTATDRANVQLIQAAEGG